MPRRRGDIQNPDYVKDTLDRRSFIRKGIGLAGIAFWRAIFEHKS